MKQAFLMAKIPKTTWLMFSFLLVGAWVLRKTLLRSSNDTTEQGLIRLPDGRTGVPVRDFDTHSDQWAPV